MAAASLTPEQRLDEEAERFLDRLNGTLKAVLGPSVTLFERTTVDDRVSVVNSGVELRSSGMPVLRLIGSYLMELDHRVTHLKVARSQLRVVAIGVNRPVFRYEYSEAYETSHLPAAHFQFHGEHNDLQDVMSRAWKKRDKKKHRGTAPDVTKLHFPVGGTRYRPCLEDVLEMLIAEFEIELGCSQNEARQALQEGREDWRTRQLKTVVRDNPAAAIEALCALGYSRPHLRQGKIAPDPRPEHARRI